MLLPNGEAEPAEKLVTYCARHFARLLSNGDPAGTRKALMIH